MIIKMYPIYDVDENGNKVFVGHIRASSLKAAERIAYAMEWIVDTEHKTITNEAEDAVGKLIDELNLEME